MDEHSARVLRAVTPPVVLDAARRVRDRRKPPEWELVPEGWAAAGGTRGWDVDGAVAAALDRLPAFRAAIAGTGLLAVPTEATLPVGPPAGWAQHEHLVLAHALLLASRGRDRVSVLDWGGGLGFSGLVARALLPDDMELDYHCREHAKLCAAGRAAVLEVQFHDDDACFEREYDLVVASGSLQFVEDWRALVARLAGASGDHVLFTRVPVVLRHASFVVLQRVAVYDTEFLGWVFQRDELVGAATDAGLDLRREFLLGYQPRVAGAPEQDETRAYLFRTRQF